MYLKSIYIQGFKSFPDKINITFSDGIAAIVGPNGSGKSNICDAIRWVLGEQSTKTLRGSKMEDVIFNGTQSRPAVGFAEVSLTIDNSTRFIQSQFDEITVTRRYYRSGESEYFINKASVRLKDIHELFMDTGLGRDGYSIIGQGRIAEILSLRSEDRRQIFEEAAGISKYRYRKAEAEKKLVMTADNLIRVNDIINELEERIGPLESQSKKAMRYLDLRGEQKNLEVNIWLSDLEKLKAAIIKSRQDYEIAASTLELNRKAADDADAQIEELYEQMRAKEIEAETLKAELHTIESRITQTQSEKAILQNNIQNNVGTIDRIKREIELQGEKDIEIDNKINALLKDKAALENKKSEIDHALSMLLLKSRMVDESFEEYGLELQKLTENLAGLLVQLSDEKIAISAGEAQLDAIIQRCAAVELEITSRKDQQEAENLSYKTCMGELADIEDQIASFDNIMGGFQKKLEVRQKRLDEITQKHDFASRELSAKNARLSMLLEMEKDFDGYNRSVKMVMQEAGRLRLKNIHAPLSRLLKMEDRFTTAIEIALGSAVQNIVVDTENDAKAAINLLKMQDGGRATFLPISTIKGNMLSEKGLESCDGFLGLACELVSYDKKYDAIVKSVLGRTAVVDNIDQAVMVAKKYSYRFKIVTLDGQVLNAGGSMTGGSISKSVGIFSRANEVLRLKTEIDDLKTNLDKLSADLISSREETTAIRSQIEGCQNEIKSASEEKIHKEAQIKTIESRIATLSDILRVLSSENTDLQTKQQELSNMLSEKKGIVADITQKVQDSENEVAKIKGDQSAVMAQRENLQNAIMNHKLEINSVEKDIEALINSIAELELQKGSLSFEKEERQNEIETIEIKNSEIEKDIGVLLQTCEELKKGIELKNEQINVIVKKRLSIEAAISGRQKELKEQRNRLLELQKEHARLENRLTSTQLEEENILSKMWDEYELTFNAAILLKADLGSNSFMSRRVSEIKTEIKSLGNINIDAIEEYKEVKQRYTFLTVQRDDLICAKEGLTGIIDDVTQKMREIFLEQFKIINKEFSVTFCELFGGGRASVELVNPDDVLESGIEIKVQPPGKNVKTLSLLSGGEQAFVAIAILFAILKVRPTPFCILDEIESALDDVNVVRFAKYLGKYSKRTQFILITHRRGTMEEADLLYGVTMQEQGVSKLLAINVKDVEKKVKM